MLLTGWALTSFFLIGSLALGHWAPLPRPARADLALQAAVARHRLPHERGFLALHVLYTACSCSRRILAHLQARGALSGLAESVLLVGDDAAQREALERRRFRVTVVDERGLAERFSLVSAPLFVLAAPDASLRYVGGYTDRKQGPEIRDGALIRAALRGAHTQPLPIFGCAVSRSLQGLLDPFGLKYSLQGDP